MYYEFLLKIRDRFSENVLLEIYNWHLSKNIFLEHECNQDSLILMIIYGKKCFLKYEILHHYFKPFRYNLKTFLNPLTELSNNRFSNLPNLLKIIGDSTWLTRLKNIGKIDFVYWNLWQMFWIYFFIYFFYCC